MKILLVLGDAGDRDRLRADLGARGHDVRVAEDADDARAVASGAHLDAVVLTDEAAHTLGPDGLSLVDALALESRPVPVVVVRAGAASDEVLARLPSIPATPDTVGDLLATLSADGWSGTVSAQVHGQRALAFLRDGRLVDVAVARARGEKALRRLVDLPSHAARLSPGDPDVLPCLHDSTEALLARARAARAPHHAASLEGYVARGAQRGAAGLGAAIFERVRGPTRVSDLLDALPEPDDAILGALDELCRSGHLHRVAEGARAPLGSAPEVEDLRVALAERTPRGFAGPPRICLVGRPPHLAAAGRALLAIHEASRPDEPPPPIPVPHALAEIRLGDGLSVEVYGVPLVSAYAPLWPIALGGCDVVVWIDDGPPEPARRAVEAAAPGRPILSARSAGQGASTPSARDLAAVLRAAVAKIGSARCPGS